MLEFLTDTSGLILATNPAQGLVDVIKLWVGPVVLLIISLFALKFLIGGRLMAFASFVLIAILVSILFYYPGIIQAIAGSFYDSSGAAGW
jgi:hypothetical protein